MCLFVSFRIPVFSHVAASCVISIFPIVSNDLSKVLMQTDEPPYGLVQHVKFNTDKKILMYVELHDHVEHIRSNVLDTILVVRGQTCKNI